MKLFCRLVLSLAILAASTTLTHAQSTQQGLAPSDDLYQTVAGLDKALFDAYNTCDLDKLSSMVAEDLEFYHDKTGLSVGRKVFH